jgi:hypothetical protein
MNPDPHPQVSWLGPRDRRYGKADLWTGFNTLVAGPPGSGKLSFLRAMTLSLDPTATCIVYDLESDPETQRATTARLLNDVDTSLAEGRTERMVHIIRHLHRLPPSLLPRFLADVEEQLELAAIPESGANQDGVIRRLHATHHEDVIWPGDTETILARIFPCRIRLSQACGRQRDLSRFVRQVVAELNRRYGRDVVEIESGVIEALRTRASTASLYELRNIIERAYFRGFGNRLTAEALEPQR